MNVVGCRCGAVRFEVTGPPIMTVECGCTSCRTAALAFAALPGAVPVLTPFGTTPYVMYRKDRATLISGAGHLREHRLTPVSKTRRVVATCCNTPVFGEFKGGHWLSMYAVLWPEGTAPGPTMRTMTKDLPDPSALPNDIPNAKTQTVGFMWRLLTAWVAMGFRSPKIEINGGLDV